MGVTALSGAEQSMGPAARRLSSALDKGMRWLVSPVAERPVIQPGQTQFHPPCPLLMAASRQGDG